MPNSTSQVPTPGQLIPLPPNFQVTWKDPRDAKLTWMRPPQFKTPIPPLIYAVISAFLVGGNAGFEGAGLPFEIRIERINTYPYMGMVPKAAPPDVVMKGMGLCMPWNMGKGSEPGTCKDGTELHISPTTDYFVTGYEGANLLPLEFDENEVFQ